MIVAIGQQEWIAELNAVPGIVKPGDVFGPTRGVVAPVVDRLRDAVVAAVERVKIDRLALKLRDQCCFNGRRGEDQPATRQRLGE